MRIQTSGLIAAIVSIVVALPAWAQVAIVSVRALNVRSGPGTDYPVTYILEQGDRVEVNRLQGDWAFVIGERGGEGWVLADYLQSQQPLPADDTNLTTVSPAARAACYGRATQAFNTDARSIVITGVRADRSINRTVSMRNTRNGATATCVVNGSTAEIVSFTLDQGSTPSVPNRPPQETETLMQFRTTNYSVRVYREVGGTTRMNVYNQGANQLVLSGAPVQVIAETEYTDYVGCTTNRTNCDGTEYTARLARSGDRSLTVRLPGERRGVTQFAQ
ncbi:MAG: SH3 domain-containing protein [Leptolyngbyaceae cyanobacterium SL_7_1]|nr:SH3 domain-containing protein [Leptolyngbyaceae cyanobacterium SL_7_1]